MNNANLRPCIRSSWAFLQGPKTGPGMIKRAFSATYVLEGGAELGREKKIARPEPPLWNCIFSFLYYYAIVFCYIWPVELYFRTVNHCVIVFAHSCITLELYSVTSGQWSCIFQQWTIVELYSLILVLLWNCILLHLASGVVFSNSEPLWNCILISQADLWPSHSSRRNVWHSRWPVFW